MYSLSRTWGPAAATGSPRIGLGGGTPAESGAAVTETAVSGAGPVERTPVDIGTAVSVISFGGGLTKLSRYGEGGDW